MYGTGVTGPVGAPSSLSRAGSVPGEGSARGSSARSEAVGSEAARARGTVTAAAPSADAAPASSPISDRSSARSSDASSCWPARSTTGTDWVGIRTGATGLSPTVCPACTSASIRAASSALGRSSGSFAISAARTGPSGPARRGSGRGSPTTAASVVSGEVRRNGESPSTAAYSVAPRPHRSEAGPGRSPWARSGAR